FGGPGTQIRYQIDVFSNPALTGAPHWSANVASAANEVVYSGPALTDAAPYYARVRVQSSSTTFSEYFYIAFELNVAPNAVADLKADNKLLGSTLGAEVVVDSRKPVITWVFGDDNAIDGQKGFEIEITTTFSGGSPDFGAAETYSETTPTSSFMIPAPDLSFATVYGI